MSRSIRFIYGVTPSNPLGDVFPSFVYDYEPADEETTEEDE